MVHETIAVGDKRKLNLKLALKYKRIDLLFGEWDLIGNRDGFELCAGSAVRQIYVHDRRMWAVAKREERGNTGVLLVEILCAKAKGHRRVTKLLENLPAAKSALKLCVSEDNPAASNFVFHHPKHVRL